ncbi:MAG: tyrosine-type recombinase/integrase [Oscillospiraceae bacterium]|jgi:integrase/recombinase XerD|nr:tyrosine-type recombinase/integrase [Oscillospiraceae bacterium]
MKNQDVSTFREQYLACCQNQKRLSGKTIKAYRIDLAQFFAFVSEQSEPLGRASVQAYIAQLHQRFQPKSAKRKTASLKAFFAWLEYEELLVDNPFQKIRTKFKEPFCLPRTIPLEHIQRMLNAAYEALRAQKLSAFHRGTLLREATVMELLFATGMRVSELCTLRREDVDLREGVIKIHGKGAKERLIQVGNPEVLACLQSYRSAFEEEIKKTDYFFINRLGNQLAEQSVRAMLKKYAAACGLSANITPHMFRHSFATLLLEEDVDIRYIQSMLGHSSITTTQIYTHVAAKKQKDILTQRHPRNRLAVNTR